VNFCKAIPAPSINAKNAPPKIPDPIIILTPPLAARHAPVSAPDAILLYGSSFLLYAASEQSNVLNNPPHIANDPPMIGARDLHPINAPRNRSPYTLSVMSFIYLIYAIWR